MRSVESGALKNSGRDSQLMSVGLAGMAWPQRHRAGGCPGTPGTGAAGRVPGRSSIWARGWRWSPALMGRMATSQQLCTVTVTFLCCPDVFTAIRKQISIPDLWTLSRHLGRLSGSWSSHWRAVLAQRAGRAAGPAGAVGGVLLEWVPHSLERQQRQGV